MDKITPGEERIIKLLNAIYLLHLVPLVSDAKQAVELVNKAMAQAQLVQEQPYETS